MNINISNKIFKGIHRGIDLCEYLWSLSLEGFNNPFTPKVKNLRKHTSLQLLSNGPSLKDFLSDELTDEIIEQYDFLIVNDFVKSTNFERIKPSFCVWSDPMFFEHTLFEERAIEAINMMAERTKWPLTLFIPKNRLKSKFLNPLRENKNINFIGFHSFPYKGFEILRTYFERRGLASGQYGNVSINAVYVGLMLGYKNIFLHGVDYTFFTKLCINEQNELCHFNEHFFDNKPVELKPIICQYKGFEGVYKTSYYITEMSSRFKGHDIMASLAKKMNVNVYNCVKESLIDSYPRKYNLYNQ